MDLHPFLQRERGSKVKEGEEGRGERRRNKRRKDKRRETFIGKIKFKLNKIFPETYFSKRIFGCDLKRSE